MSSPNAPTVARMTYGRWMPWLILAMAFFAFYLLYFSPVLLQHRYLGPGDGEVYYLPFFELPISQTWNELIVSGSPIINDIQSQQLYPLRWLSPSFNLLVVSAYAIAAFGMFGLALRVTESRLGAMAAALIVSGGGFMTAHLGHLSIIHAAAWVPAMLWALSCLRGSRSGWPVVLGAFAVAMCIYGGHPQVSIIGLLLAGCYGVHEIAFASAQGGRREGLRVLAAVTAIFVLGLALGAPALLPLLDVSKEGVRAVWSVADFNSYSHQPGSLRILFFPNLFGAHGASGYGQNTSGSLTELAVFAGTWTWCLALAAVLGWKRDRSHWFWVGALVAALLLTLGTITPLGRLVYEMPVLGKFRAQARFGLIAIIALAMLAAYGLSALLRAKWDRQRYAMLLLGSAAFFGIVCAWALRADIPAGRMSPNVIVPVALMVASLIATALLAWRRSAAIAMGGLLFLIADLGSFGWVYEWRYPTDTSTRDVLPSDTAKLIHEIASGEGRLLPLGAATLGVEPVRPNVNMRYGIPSVVGYGPLVTNRYMTYAGTDTIGNFATADPTAPIMDVLAVRWISGSAESLSSQVIGHGCGVTNSLRRLRARIPDGMQVSKVTLLSHLSCSTDIATGVELARVRMLDGDGAELSQQSVNAGEHTAEWAHERADVRAIVKHKLAPVADTFDAGGFPGLWFKGQWQIGGPGARDIEIALSDDHGVPIRIKALLVSDSAGGEMQLPLAPAFEEVAGTMGPPRAAPRMPPVRMRLGYRGMAWSVCDVRASTQDVIVASLAGAGEVDGAPLDPHRTALIEPGVQVPGVTCTSAPEVHVVARKPGKWTLRTTDTPGSSLLVVSESYNRDWVARVDGAKASVLPVDGLVLGIPVPAGAHEVTLSYRPRSLYRGLALACLALLICVAWIAPWHRLRRPRTAISDKD